MLIKYGKSKQKNSNIVYTVVSVILLVLTFLYMVSYLYTSTEKGAYEDLHIQTKQIKDDIRLQMISDRENLQTMASFAAKLYKDGEDYDILFESFQPIGLIENIGILNRENMFATKSGKMDLNGKISFEQEAAKGAYISGREKDLTHDNHELIRSAVPIVTAGETVGILYGVVNLDAIGEKYGNMAKELDAQLWVYDRETGDLVIDTINKKLGNISFLSDREYNEGYSYKKMRESDAGFSSFVSKYSDENLYVHYSTIDDLDWVISLARYDSQVFAKTHILSRVLFASFMSMIAIIAVYMLLLIRNERKINSVTGCASETRRILLETTSQQNNIVEALKRVCLFAKAKKAMVIDTDGKDYDYVLPGSEEYVLEGKVRSYFISVLLGYATDLHKLDDSTLGVICIKPDKHLAETDPEFYKFLNERKIKEISYAAVTNKTNHTVILVVVNPKNSKAARMLGEKIAVCFSIALYNKNYLSKTELAATTDALTGTLNRVVYKRDLLEFDKEKPQKFSCVYIDVNELHFKNNKYGHAAGDEMLLYIANTLKEVFYGHKVYRIGGDEFLVFAEGVERESVNHSIDLLVEQLKLKDYYVAIGTSYRTRNTDTEDMVREAEIRMYEAKAQYYQNKEQKSILRSEDENYVRTKTGILEIDAMLSVMQEHYNGIYRVSLITDRAHRILMPAYLSYREDEEHFSGLVNKYIYEMVNPDFHRAMMSFLNYDAIRAQLLEGNIPRITYKKVNGETVILSVYKLGDADTSIENTLWVFAKD